jgi:DNA-binding XRE family transcriptional regulator
MPVHAICPTCKRGRLEPWVGPVPMWGLVDVAGRGEHCPECDELLIHANELGRIEKVAADEIASRGIVTGREFKFIRKAADLRAVDLAELLDVTPETVSRWEHDERPIPRLVAFTIGELYLHPKITRAKLEALATPRPKPKPKSKPRN